MLHFIYQKKGDNNMKIYTVNVCYEDTYEIEAESEDEAVDIAYESFVADCAPSIIIEGVENE
jgi:hypothetical protein